MRDVDRRSAKIRSTSLGHPLHHVTQSHRKTLHMTRSRLLLAALALTAALGPVQADEGMWTFNNVPADKIEKAYGFRPDQAWLDHVRLSSVRLAQGCSGSFVSARGLVQTNHHCARACIEQLSTATRNMADLGFYARDEKGHIKCPTIAATP